jgi:hypothetical protein
VLARGSAEILAAGPARDRALEALRERYPQYRAMPLTGPVIRITPERVRSWQVG